MKKCVKGISIFIAAALTCLLLAGCGAGADVAYYTDGDFYYYDLSVSVSVDRLKEMERTALYNPAALSKWTVSGWLYELTRQLTFSDGSRFQFVSEGITDGRQRMNYRRKIPASTVENQPEGEPDENYDFLRKNFFYVYQTTVTVSNPFNGMRAEFDGAGITQTDLMSVIRYGLKAYDSNGQIVTYLPSLFETFPSLKEDSVGSFTLGYLMPAPKSGSSTGETVYIDGQKFFRFDRLFDLSEQTMTYQYYSPNSTGWYITAIALGAIVTGIILLVTAKKKKNNKEIAAGGFPYDPFDEGGGDNLPTGYNGDPFKY